MKLASKLLFLLLSFFGLWFLLQQIDWIQLLKVQELSQKSEEKLGELLWKQFENEDDVLDHTILYAGCDSILTRLCNKNGFNRKTFQLHVVNEPVINAFALPDSHMVVFSGLIEACRSSDELAGVMAHEMAHIIEGHVAQKLMKEIGLSVLVSMSGGGAGGDLAKETAKMLASTAFDRGLEKEADLMAVDYLVNAQIKPDALADFMANLAKTEPEMPTELKWLGTHPQTRERMSYLWQKATEFEDVEYTEAIDTSLWQNMKAYKTN